VCAELVQPPPVSHIQPSLEQALTERFRLQQAPRRHRRIRNDLAHAYHQEMPILSFREHEQARNLLVVLLFATGADKAWQCSPMVTFTFLELLGNEARALALKHFRTKLDIAAKADDSPVTVADREIERRLRELILTQYPTANIVGEEEGGEIGDGVTWVIDPIDGTRSFVAGLPLFGTLVAVLDKRIAVYGMIEIPVLGERWLGYGNRAILNGVPCKVSSCEQLRDARLCATDPQIFVGAASAAFSSLSRAVSISRFGTDCYGYALLASGHVDLVVEAGLEIYDVMALIPVVLGAGGVITTWSGHAIDERFDGTVIACATRALHAEALRFLRQ